MGPKNLSPQTKEDEVRVKVKIITMTIDYLKRSEGKIMNSRQMIQREEQRLKTLKRDYPEFFV